MSFPYLAQVARIQCARGISEKMPLLRSRNIRHYGVEKCSLMMDGAALQESGRGQGSSRICSTGDEVNVTFKEFHIRARTGMKVEKLQSNIDGSCISSGTFFM